jgi:hypothetical protein
METLSAKTDWASIKSEFEAGRKPIRQIARAHGISHTAIIKRCKREKWVRNTALQKAPFETPAEFLLALINDPRTGMDLKVRAAVATMRVEARRQRALPVPGKKESAAEAAREAGVGRFATPSAPQLVVDNVGKPPPDGAA